MVQDVIQDPDIIPGYEFPKSILEPQFKSGIGLSAEFVEPEGLDEYANLRLSNERLRWAKQQQKNKQNERLSEIVQAKTKPRKGMSIFGFKFYGDSGNAFADPDTGLNDPAAQAINALETYTPFAAGWAKGRKNEKVKEIFDRVKEGEAVSDHELKILGTQMAIDENRSKESLAVSAADVVSRSAVFGLEMAGTGGLASYFRGGQAAGKGASLLSRAGEATKLATAQAVISGRAFESATDLRNRQSKSAQMIRNNRGEHEISYDETEADSMLQAFPKGLSLALMEGLSERAGGAIGRGIGKAGQVASKVPGATAVGKLIKDRLPAVGKGDTLEFMRKFGWDGVVNEFLEERVNEVGQYALGAVVDRIAGGNETVEDMGLTQVVLDTVRGREIKNGGQKSRQLLTELLAFGGMGASVTVANRLFQRSNVKALDSELFDEENKHVLRDQWIDIRNEGETEFDQLEKVNAFLAKVKGGNPSRSDIAGTVFDRNEITQSLNEERRRKIYESAVEAQTMLQEVTGKAGEVEEMINKAVDEAIKINKREVADQAVSEIEGDQESQDENESVDEIVSPVEKAKQAQREITEEQDSETPKGQDYIDQFKENQEVIYTGDQKQGEQKAKVFGNPNIKTWTGNTSESGKKIMAIKVQTADGRVHIASGGQLKPAATDIELRSQIAREAEFKPQNSVAKRIKERFPDITGEQGREFEAEINETWERDHAPNNRYNKDYDELYSKAAKAWKSASKNKGRKFVPLATALARGDVDSSNLKNADEWAVSYFNESESFKGKTLDDLLPILEAGKRDVPTREEHESEVLDDLEGFVEPLEDYVERKANGNQAEADYQEEIPFASKTPQIKRGGWFRNKLSRIFTSIMSPPVEGNSKDWASRDEMKVDVMKTWNPILRPILGTGQPISFTKDSARVGTLQYDPNKKIVEINEDYLSAQSFEYVEAAMREEVIHGAIDMVIRQKGKSSNAFYTDVYNAMTQEERDAVHAVYPAVKNRANIHTAMEFTRQVVQKKLYGQITEEFTGAATKKIKRLFKRVFDYLSKLFGNKTTYDPLHSEVLSLASRLVTDYDPKARRDSFPLDKKSLEDRAADAIYEKVFEKGFDSRFEERDLWAAVQGTIPSLVDGQLNQKGLYDAMHHAVGKMIAAESDMLNPNKDFQASRVANAAISKFLKALPISQVNAPLPADLAHSISVMGQMKPGQNILLQNLSSSEYFGQFAENAGSNAIHGAFPKSDTDLVITSIANSTSSGLKNVAPVGLRKFEKMIDALNDGSSAIAITDAPERSSKPFNKWMESFLSRDDVEVNSHYVVPNEMAGSAKKKRIFMVTKVSGEQNGITQSRPTRIKGRLTTDLMQAMDSTKTLVKPSGTTKPLPVEAEQIVEEITAEEKPMPFVADDGSIIVDGQQGDTLRRNYRPIEKKEWFKRFQETVSSFLSIFRTNWMIPEKAFGYVATKLRLKELTDFLSGHQDDGENYSGAKELFRLHQLDLPNAILTARSMVAKVVDGLTNDQVKLMSAYIVYGNAIRSYENGEGIHLADQSLPPEENLLVLRHVYGQLREKALANKDIADALKRRGEVIENAIYKGIDAGILNREQWEDFIELDETGRPRYERYMHQEVSAFEGISSVLRSRKKIAERSDDGTETLRDRDLDYNTHYVAQEQAWLTTLELRANNARFHDALNRQYGRKQQLIKKAKLNNDIALVGGQENWDEIQRLKAAKAPPEAIYALDPVSYYKAEMRKAGRQMNGHGYKLTELGRNRKERYFTLSRIIGENPDAAPSMQRWMDAFEQFEQLYAERLPNPENWKNIFHREENTTSNDGRKWRDTHAIFDPTGGNFLYSSMALSDYIHQNVIEDLAEDSGTKQLLEQHARNEAKIMVLPKPVVEQLEHLSDIGKKRAEGKLRLGRSFRRTLGLVKPGFLLGPSRIVGYTLRNAIGDMDAIIASNPGVLSYFNDSFRELIEYHRASLKNDPPADVKRAIELGAMNDTFFEGDIKSIADVKEFQRLFKDYHEMQKEGQSVPAKVVEATWNGIKKYFEKATELQTFRENLFRLAAYKYFLANANNENLTYGATQRSEAREVRKWLGPEEFAARMSRDLLIDYSNLSVVGNQIRAYAMPFWSFSEQNLKRYYNIIDNSIEKLAETGNPVDAAKIGTLVAAKVAGTYVSIYLFNQMMMALLGIDPDRDFNKSEKNQLSLIVGRDANGNIILLRNVGSVGDVLAWSGINEFINAEGNEGIGSTLTNKLYSSSHPAYKMGLEISTGKTYFPDLANGRYAPTDEIIASNLGVSDPYREVKGIAGFGSSARPGSLASGLTGRSLPTKIIGATNPRLNAIGNAQSIYRRVMGIESPSGSRPSFPNFGRMRTAAYHSDKKGFERAAKAFTKNGGDFNQFEKQLGRMKLVPYSHREDLYQSITEKERETVAAAEEYMADTRQKMAVWFNEFIEADPEQKSAFIRKKVAILSSNITGKTMRERKESKESKRRAFDWLRDHGIEYPEVVKTVIKSSQSLKSDTARRNRRSQAARMWKEFSAQ